MKIQIVGGGPGGLSFALLMKRLDPSHEITIFERDAADETFGWGVAFSEQAFTYLRETDRAVYDRFRECALTWNHLDIVHRDQRVRVQGTPSAGIARLDLLDILRTRCLQSGVVLRFHSNVRDLRGLPDCDLLVGADGANSLVRHTFAETFQPDLRIGRNKYVWLGIRHRLDGYTLTVRPTQAGVFAAHGYPHGEAASTVIIECSETTWARAGLNVKTDHEACVYLSDLFTAELAGHLLLTNDRMKWRNFLLIANERWFHQHVVLVGDALHTVHFSTGAGTRMAVEDAIALARAFEQHGEVPAALGAYEAARQPVVRRFQDAARDSLTWFENLDRNLALSPARLAYEVVTRTRRIDPAALRDLDPAFAALVEQSRS